MAQSLAPAELSAQARALVTHVQDAIPLVSRPFKAIGKALGTDEEVVLEQLAGLKAAGLIRKIGPVFEPACFGIVSELLAAQVASEELARVGTTVSAWRPVTHCYAREHRVNLWLAALSAKKEWFEEAQASISSLPGVEGVWRLPALRRFKVAVRFDLTEDASSLGRRMASPLRARRGEVGFDERKGAHCCAPLQNHAPLQNRAPLQKQGDDPCKTFTTRQFDIRLLAALEEDLPLCPEPFSALARVHGLEEERILATLQQWTAAGYIRRYGALVSHLRLGFGANAMTVWQVAAEHVEAVGAALASSEYVSHCYERPPFQGFPFNLYAMVHERTKERCLAVIEELSQQSRDCAREVLFSTREFKKSSPKYAELLAES